MLTATFNEVADDVYEPANDCAKKLCEFSRDDEVSGDQLELLTQAGITVEVGVPKYEYKEFKRGVN